MHFVKPSVGSFSDPSNKDTLLFSAVERHGRVWSTIVSQYFPGRTGLDAKNRSVLRTISWLIHNPQLPVDIRV